jgi:hypothetical protein
MRRIAPFTNLDESKTALPSTAVVDMFGRLFGTILATLFEKNTLKPSTSQKPLRDHTFTNSIFFHRKSEYSTKINLPGKCPP